MRDLSDEQREAASAVIDLDAEETTCPACQETIRPDARRCPECGLNFGS